MKDNRSFFEKLAGVAKIKDPEMDEVEIPAKVPAKGNYYNHSLDQFTDSDPEEGELTVDVYQTPTEVVIKTMVAGVKPEDLDVAITRDMVTIKGKRETERSVSDDDYYHRELYWGSFSRTIMLPAEVEVEEAEAVEKHGLLIITLPKIDKHKQAKLRVKG